ncbi:23S rRNA (adenine(2503)-C(2))-methyltransferase RlmN [Roseomonas sp. OT10]|uniref:23S rRNA (adenine(2503)-C(2))-methyltransferase RlmN n=1 Tax=Roseomonas cutis TaxID=2897332 RepID=UPI001E40E014|nr:23S rRNA (adenine(2503)-C(2))-methyltransferase RlmN [Roseomonas sp. OT10]UFN48886.1 23S rRNA (adenine(2503)-C(2))-methyltransferase RlmN [Roseomonas sp. OT10]
MSDPAAPRPAVPIPAGGAAAPALPPLLDAGEAARILAKSALFAPPPATLPDGRRDLVGLSREELAAEMVAMGEKPFRAKQLWHWIYHQGERDFARMTTIAKPMQARLAERFVIGRPGVTTEQTSRDGTRKWLFGFRDGQQVETVYIPETDRGAVCISTQVGCTLSCRFCHTGTQKLVRNLGAAEIVGQFMAARDSYGEWPGQKGWQGGDPARKAGGLAPTRRGNAAEGEDGPGDGEDDPSPRLLSNIVVMGMGEPLYNYENVAKALKIIMDHEGIGLSRRRITLSTSGVVPMMDRAGEELGVNLAVSLHAVRDDLRDEIVPLNRKYPIAELMAACRRYPRASNSRRITFEYVMLDGVNDGEADARELVRLLRGLPAKVNLIPFNPWPGSPYQTSRGPAIERFAAIVNDAGYASPVRRPRGRDILAACGQLKTESERARRRPAA